MTRSEFIDEVTSWDELIDFCRTNDCDSCDDIYDEDARDDLLDERLQSKVEDVDCWQDLLDFLSDIPTGYDYYREVDYYEFTIADDDDFNAYKNDVLDWADDNDIWDEEEEEGIEANDEEPPVVRDNGIDVEGDDDDFVVEEEPSIEELINVCNTQLQQISKKQEEDDAAENNQITSFLAEYI